MRESSQKDYEFAFSRTSFSSFLKTEPVSHFHLILIDPWYMAGVDQIIIILGYCPHSTRFLQKVTNSGSATMSQRFFFFFSVYWEIIFCLKTKHISCDWVPSCILGFPSSLPSFKLMSCKSKDWTKSLRVYPDFHDT